MSFNSQLACIPCRPPSPDEQAPSSLRQEEPEGEYCDACGSASLARVPWACGNCCFICLRRQTVLASVVRFVSCSLVSFRNAPAGRPNHGRNRTMEGRNDPWSSLTS